MMIRFFNIIFYKNKSESKTLLIVQLNFQLIDCINTELYIQKNN